VAWPRSAQLTTAFLLGLVTALLLVHVLGQARWGARPTELTYRVDLNHAGHAELLQLPGVGETLAARIEDYREEHGGFGSVDELTNVRGIGHATLERLRPHVLVRLDEERDTQPVARARRSARSPGKNSAMASKEPGTRKVASKKGAGLTQPVDINRATLEELQRVPNIGAVLAQRIVDERGKGPFKSINDLCRVSGIKQKKVEQLRPYVTVGSKDERIVAAEKP
jgi:competence protein ComEA